MGKKPGESGYTPAAKGGVKERFWIQIISMEWTWGFQESDHLTNQI
jgi:hypothetical protein